jgi:hypothetical protein
MVHPEDRQETNSHVPLSALAIPSKLHANGFVQPEITTVQESKSHDPSLVFAAGLKLHAPSNVQPGETHESKSHEPSLYIASLS